MFFLMRYTRSIEKQCFLNEDKNKPIYNEKMVGLVFNDFKYLEFEKSKKSSSKDRCVDLINYWNRGNHGFKYEFISVEPILLEDIPDEKSILSGLAFENVNSAKYLKK